MVILTGKLIYGVALQPHCRFLFIPWVKSNCVMRCLKVRNFGSSIPVRYIPKNSPKPRIPLVSTPHENDFEERGKHICLDPNVGRAESREVSKRRFVPKKPPKNDNSRSLVTPVNDFHDISRHGSVESDVLGLESVGGGKIMGRSYAVGGTPDRNHRLVGSLDLNAETEVDEEVGGFKSLEDTEELGYEIRENEASGKLAFQSSKSNQDAENMAFGFLSRRALTTVELRKKLIAKRYPLHVVNEVITKFQIRKFLDDFQYAEAFSRSRFSSLSWGPGRIKQEYIFDLDFEYTIMYKGKEETAFEIFGISKNLTAFITTEPYNLEVKKALHQKGVSEADAEKAIKLVFKDGESGEDHQSRIGLSKSSLDQLFVQASKRWLQGQGQPVDKRKSKTIQWLRYRGFNWGVVNVVLKKLESEFPP